MTNSFTNESTQYFVCISMKFISISVMSYLGNMMGKWNFKFGGLAFQLGVSGGKLTIGGKPVQLQQSTSPQYLSANGWMRFDYQGGWTFYIKFQAGGAIKVIAMQNGVLQSGMVTKLGGGVGVGGGFITGGISSVCIRTTGGTANGECCHFPFKYQGRTYTSECSILKNKGKPWCYVNADRSKWGNCVSGGLCLS